MKLFVMVHVLIEAFGCGHRVNKEMGFILQWIRVIFTRDFSNKDKGAGL